MPNRNSSRYFYSFLLLITLSVSHLSAQNAPKLQVLTPPPPEVSALGKFGIIPVNHFSGVPDISYPIYTIEEGNIKLPITLRYHAGGIRVKEDASEVGLGWALSAGGTVVSSVRGYPDFDAGGFSSHYASIPDNPDIITTLKSPLMSVNNRYYLWGGDGGVSGEWGNDFLLGSLLLPKNGVMHQYVDEFQVGLEGRGPDWASDLYTVTMGDRSVNFVFDNNFKPVILGDGALQIELVWLGNYPDFTITDEQGITYYYSQRQFNYSNVNNDPYYMGNRTSQSINTWHLKKIVSPVHGEINFNYQSSSTDLVHPLPAIAETELIGNTSPNTPQTKVNKAEHYSIFDKTEPESISFSDGTVRFLYAGQRLDLHGASRLYSIEVYDKNETLVKKINLDNNAYFGPAAETGGGGYSWNGSYYAIPLYPGSGYFNKRLKLKSITEVNVSNSNNVKTTTYSYNEQVNLPDKLSFAIDHWGYYNGKEAPRLSPPATVYLNGSPIALEGANRDANPLTMQANILTGITHPTGGTTTFTYETNQFLQTDEVITWQDANTNFYKASGSAVMNASGFADANGNFTAPASWNNKKLNIFTLIDRGSSYPSYYELNILVYENGYFLKRIPTIQYTTSVDSSVTIIGGRSYRVFFEPYTQDFYNACTIRMQVYVKQVSSTSQNVVNTHYSGGLRVSKITNYDPFTQKTNIKKYTYSDGTEGDVPIYVSFPGADFYNNGTSDMNQSSNSFYYRYGQSVYPFSITPNAAYFGYGKVQLSESEDNNLNGLTEYQYNAGTNLNINTMIRYGGSQTLFTGFLNPIMPDIPSVPAGRGDLLEEKYYRNNTGTLVPVTRTAFQYNRNQSFNLWQMITKSGVSGWAGGHQERNFKILAHQFPIPIYRNILKRKQNFVYDDAGNEALTTYEEYTYDETKGHYQLTKKTTGTSRQEILNQYYIYPQDYLSMAGQTPSDPVAGGIKKLQDKHVILPVESYNEKVTQAGVSSYYNGLLNIFYTDKPLIKQIQVLESDKPLTTFTPSSISGGVFAKNSLYKDRVLFQYDASNRILQQSLANDMPVSYLWGSHLRQPLAEVKNAEWNTIWYEGFEETALSGRIAEGYTGNYSFNGTYQKSMSGIPNGKYLLSYRGKSGSTWSLVQNEVTVTNNTYAINITGQIDDVRFYPASAQMTTNTLQLLTGVTSITNPQNIPSYFEYDGFQRLKTVRDQNRNIIKSIDYQYQKTE